MLPPPKPTTSTERSFVLPNGCTEVLHLMGATRLADFLNFARERADLTAHSEAGDDCAMELAESWRDAAATYETLQSSEPYPGESPTAFPLPDSMRKHADALLALPQIQREFDRVPVALGMVPLAQLVCAQQRIDLHTVQGGATEAAMPSDEALIAACLPLEAPPHQFQIAQQGDGSVTFVADNHDIRLFTPQILTSSAVDGKWPGYVQRALALPVGFSANVLNVIRFQNRLVLNNGYHRAFSLYRRGVTHVPAIIQVCRQWEDVGLVGSSEIFNNGSVYFDRKRPPLIKDFCDRRLTISFAVPISRKFVRIKYEVETGYFRS
jgi:hypothetical protein